MDAQLGIAENSKAHYGEYRISEKMVKAAFISTAELQNHKFRWINGLVFHDPSAPLHELIQAAATRRLLANYFEMHKRKGCFYFGKSLFLTEWLLRDSEDFLITEPLPMMPCISSGCPSYLKKMVFYVFP